jgi:hypothetical protein
MFVLLLRSSGPVLLCPLNHLVSFRSFPTIRFVAADRGVPSEFPLFLVLFFLAAGRPFSLDILSFDDFFDALVVSSLAVADAFVVFCLFSAHWTVGFAVISLVEVSLEVQLGEKGFIGLFQFLDVGLGVVEEI